MPVIKFNYWSWTLTWITCLVIRLKMIKGSRCPNFVRLPIDYVEMTSLCTTRINSPLQFTNSVLLYSQPPTKKVALYYKNNSMLGVTIHPFMYLNREYFLVQLFFFCTGFFSFLLYISIQARCSHGKSSYSNPQFNNFSKYWLCRFWVIDVCESIAQ